MKKMIVRSNGTKVEMDFELLMENYGGLVTKIAKKYKGMDLTQDDIQEGYLGLWNAFRTYNEVNCFSTHATWKVRQRFQHMKTNEVALKRDTREKKFVNMEYDLGDGNTAGDMIEDVNARFEDDLIESELLRYIKQNLNEFEMDLLLFNLGHIKAKAIVEKYETTKSNVSNRNARFKEKMQKLIITFNS